MSSQTKIIEWGRTLLLTKGLLIERDPEIIVETPWSTVIQFTTSKGCFYLKQTPAALYVECEIIKAIQTVKPDSLVPTVLFHNDKYNCFIMTACGDFSLRTKFCGTLDEALLSSGLHSYINIMRLFEQKIDTLITMGVPDWRITSIPNRYVELLEKKDMLLDEGLTLDELDKLMKLLPTIKSICKFLSEQKVKDTLVNGDFNENNLILNVSTQQISVIDWGESVITHPFFSIAAHLRNNARRYKLELTAHLLENIRKECLSCWSDIANDHELEEIYQNILRLLPIFSSLAIYRLQVATHNKSKDIQNWFIAGFLKTLLENVN